MKGRRLLLTVLALGLLVGVWFQGIYLPLSDRLEFAQNAILAAETRLNRARELEGLQQRLQPILELTAEGESLMTRLASRVDALALRPRLKQMRTLPIRPGPEGISQVKEAAYMRFDGLDMKELAALLQDLERLEKDVWVRKMDLRMHGKRAAMIILEIEEMRTE